MIDSTRPVQICLGPGGVGKTTIAAAAGMAGALAGERVVVLTIDPARRLADTLGLARPKVLDTPGLGRGRAVDTEPLLVPGPWSGELWATMLDPVETLQSLIDQHGRADQTRRVRDNRLFRAITESLSGMNEYMASERLFQLHNDPRFDRVIVDTPPSRHAVDFLDSPGRLTDFIDNRLYRAVFAPRHGLLRSLNAAAQVVLRLTAKLVGAELVDDVVRLFADLEGLDQGFRERAQETSKLLHGPECGYTLVTTARRQPVGEAAWIKAQLERRSHRLDAIVVNRLTPFGPERPRATRKGSKAERRALDMNLAQLAELGRAEDELVAELAADDRGIVPTLRVVERHHPIRSVDDLVELARVLAAPVETA